MHWSVYPVPKHEQDSPSLPSAPPTPDRGPASPHNSNCPCHLQSKAKEITQRNKQTHIRIFKDLFTIYMLNVLSSHARHGQLVKKRVGPMT